MLQYRHQKTREFSDTAQFLIPIMHTHLSHTPKGKIALNPQFIIGKQSFIVPIDKASSDSISLEKFMEQLFVRCDDEQDYIEEINNKKSIICDRLHLIFVSHDSNWLK